MHLYFTRGVWVLFRVCSVCRVWRLPAHGGSVRPAFVVFLSLWAVVSVRSGLSCLSAGVSGRALCVLSSAPVSRIRAVNCTATVGIIECAIGAVIDLTPFPACAPGPRLHFSSVPPCQQRGQALHLPAQALVLLFQLPVRDLQGVCALHRRGRVVLGRARTPGAAVDRCTHAARDEHTAPLVDVTTHHDSIFIGPPGCSTPRTAIAPAPCRGRR